MTSPLNYLVCFFLPISTCWFLSSGLHSIGGALAWTLPCWIMVLADWLSPKLTSQPEASVPKGFYDAIIVSLACLQLANIVLMLDYVSRLSWLTPSDFITGVTNIIVIRFLLGTCSGISGIVVAHELLHRQTGFMQQLGRVLLCSLCHEHFVVAHKQGHHLGVKLQDDFTTARLGESFRCYWRRVYRSHLQYAWRSEQMRLGITNAAFSPRLSLQNRVLQGLGIELLLVAAILYIYGWVATGMFLYQAFIAVRILEAINYVQHWGLTDARYSNSFGWVNNAWFTHYLLLGLANHIGHHQDEHKHFYEIAYSDQGPKMPYGYLIMNLWAKLHNASYQQMALRELEQYRAIYTAKSRELEPYARLKITIN
ncbi:MAG: fatty acid desaturase [Methylococcales bacterium]